MSAPRCDHIFRLPDGAELRDEFGGFLGDVECRSDELRLYVDTTVSLTPAVAAELADVLRTWACTRPIEWDGAS